MAKHRQRSNESHGLTKTRLYRIWTLMRYRCRHVTEKNMRYAGRGIAVYPEWESFEAFRLWSLSHGYTDELTIDRNDNDGDYTPENCRWVTQKVQARNRLGNRILCAFGEEKLVCDWVLDERCAVNEATFMSRVNTLNWSPEKALTTPAIKQDAGVYVGFGESKSISEWCKDSRCVAGYDLVYNRLIEFGWPLEMAITTPCKTPKLREAFGELKSLSDWSKDHRCLVKESVLLKRHVVRGWSLEEAIMTPPNGRRKKPKSRPHGAGRAS